MRGWRIARRLAGIRTGYGFRRWVRVSVVGAGFGGGCGDWDWVRALSTAFSLLRHSLNVLKITVANARTRRYTPLTRSAFAPPPTIHRPSIPHPQRERMPAVRLGASSPPPPSPPPSD